MIKHPDIKVFAERVERLCDFLLDKVEKNESQDIKIIQDLKNDAANLQVSSITAIEGLDNYMRGFSETPKER